MNEGMMQEIIDDWMSWKYDILDMISIILEEKLKQMKGNK